VIDENKDVLEVIDVDIEADSRMDELQCRSAGIILRFVLQEVFACCATVVMMMMRRRLSLFANRSQMRILPTRIRYQAQHRPKPWCDSVSV